MISFGFLVWAGRRSEGGNRAGYIGSTLERSTLLLGQQASGGHRCSICGIEENPSGAGLAEDDEL